MDFKAIERKWQNAWKKEKAFKSVEDPKKKKFYALEMYPYPSASFLHMGHVRNFTIGDVVARFKRMQGFNVLYPMGYDSFGLPAENAAKKEGIHPKVYAESSIKKIREYQEALGNSYDWGRVLASHDTEYYRWNQYFFLKLFEKGLAYRKKAPVNWCNNCETVLANEEVEAGKCWRCDNEVVKKDLEQWFFRITDYADRLLKDLGKVEWPEKIKLMQRNWIGKSEGVTINFGINAQSKPKRVVIIHGSPLDNEAVKNRWHLKGWIPWLRAELTKHNIEVVIPEFPNPIIVDYEKWAKTMEKLFVDKDTTIIAHSAGGQFILSWLTKNKKKIHQLLLVAPSGKRTQSFRNNCIGDFSVDATIKNLTNDISLFVSDNDSARHLQDVDEYVALFGGRKILLPNRKHFSERDGIREFPELLHEIIPSVDVFTTRPDTLFGVTYLVLSPGHPLIHSLKTNIENWSQVESYIEEAKNSNPEEDSPEKEKTGVLLKGISATNPMNHEKVPVWIADYVLSGYGTGAVMAVPAHDQRDFEFATKYKLPIKIVICTEYPAKKCPILKEAYTDEGHLIESGKFTGLNNEAAKIEITNYIEKNKLGKRITNYKIRDWLISRQRYWGTPIPIIYCDKCGVVPVNEKDLPVKLPEKVDFKSKISPLMSSKEFLNVKCPKCNGKARRETDTMGGFMDSSWYFLRYCDNKNGKMPFDKKKVSYWMPVDQYIGGVEHAVAHLLYARFFTKVLKDLGFVGFDEPFTKLFNQGIVYKNGVRMSKSKGNVVYQTDVSDKYGIDTARLFLMFVSSPDKNMEWSDQGVEGSSRFINKIIRMKESITNKNDKRHESKIHSTVKKVTEGIENFEYPKAIVALFEAADYFNEGISKENYETLLKLLSPFAPHITEELWHELDNKDFISLSRWPKFEDKKIDEKAEALDKFLENTRSDVHNVLKLTQIKPKKITLFVSEEWKYALFEKLSKEESRDFKIILKKVMDPKHGEETVKIVTSFCKGNLKTDAFTDQKNEIKILKDMKASLEKEFNSEIEVMKAEDSKEAKAKNALPGKAAILVQ